MAREQLDSGTDTITSDNVRLKQPRMFKVILLNDDYSTMDFVVAVLEQIFRKSPAEAVQIMLHVHQRGQGLCGVFPKEIAEAKVKQVHDRAKAEGHPLRCMMEEA
ncbi:MAG: ATP-dependent Clp protease adapter ClpS [Oligoflexia bacterium]|nr:ATP-dependent Clp protease adapter ClpS [Oligoflexia bacterium]